MNEQLKSLVKQAGFILWEDEDWRPTDPNQIIDWSTNYDVELNKLVELILTDVIRITDDTVTKWEPEDLIDKFKQHFGIVA